MFSAESINMQPKIQKQKALFIAILLFSLQVESVVEKGYYWSLDTNHLDYLNTSVVTWNKTSFTAGTCLMNCADGSSCKSVFYHPQRHICLASSSYKRALPENEKTDSGWMYYSEQYGCDAGYTHVGSSGLCLKLHTEILPFYQAMEVCESERAKLTVWDNEQELSDIFALCRNAGGTYVWIGTTDLVVEGEWKFWNGKTLRALDWMPNEPTGGRGENCLALNKDLSQYGDVACNSSFAFVCQRFVH